tara:strand:+ start:918 stop:1661 length:744 start_codon:yes stop_codon:yes gene_type:complete
MASFFNTKLIKIEETSSTNDFAYELLKKGKIKEGAVIFSQFQKKGKGQRGAKWESEYGKNILMSIVLSPDILVVNQFQLNICISLALHDFSKKYFLEKTKIKWPNDLLIENEKLAGILIKNIVKEDKIKYAIVGIGININQINFDEFSLKATSFKKLIDKNFDVLELQKELLIYIENRYLQLKQESFVKMRKEYLKHLFAFNDWRNYKISEKEIKARIVGIDEAGRILLEFENNHFKAFSLKEIVFL